MQSEAMPFGWGFGTWPPPRAQLGVRCGRARRTAHVATDIDIEAVAAALVQQPYLLMVTTSVLAEDLTVKFALTKAQAYQAIQLARCAQ